MSTSYPPYLFSAPGVLTIGDNLTDCVRQLRIMLGPSTRVVGRITVDEVLSNVLHVLEGRIMIDEQGRLHPLCKHDSGNVKVVCQCLDCGNVVPPGIASVTSVIPPAGAV